MTTIYQTQLQTDPGLRRFDDIRGLLPDADNPTPLVRLRHVISADIEAASVCRELGIRYHRAPCVNAHPEFIAMLGRRVLALEAGPVR